MLAEYELKKKKNINISNYQALIFILAETDKKSVKGTLSVTITCDSLIMNSTPKNDRQLKLSFG